MLVGRAAIAIFEGGQATDHGFAIGNQPVIFIHIMKTFFYRRRGVFQRALRFLAADYQKRGFVVGAHGYDRVGQGLPGGFDELPTGRFEHAKAVSVIDVEIAQNFFAIGRSFVLGRRRGCGVRGS